MAIEFVEAQNVGAGSSLYKERADWFDQQMSKAVLGQTATTDAIAGGHAVGREHRAVQEDIERSDAKALSAVLNRDLIQPWIQLERGPQRSYPRLRIGRAEDRDVQLTISGVNTMVPLGMQVPKKFMNTLLGVPLPEPGEEVLTPAPAGFSPGGGPPIGMPPALNASAQPAKRSADEVAALAHAAEQLAAPALSELLGHIRAALQSAESLDDLKAELGKLKLKPDKLASALRLARVYAQLSGRADIADAAG
jgi:phage gp29-like protein